MKSLLLKERFLAMTIDFLFISILTIFILSFFEFKFFEIFDTSFIGRKWTLNYNVNFIVMILYFFLCDFLSKGISLGKKIMNLEIEKKSSNYILQYRLCRTLLKCFFLFSILLPITLIYFFVKNEVFYDKILNTNVVK
ncbi:RDD family protein [Flavobacterium macrobrachii]|uniref:RDD family protein n=1 Tax=Flavobacterium macrobrachii TaxID=591204 RepID=A0ABS2D0K1_9FLAO|nr:RDD family protein [Flavobacterium macrobrachii]